MEPKNLSLTKALCPEARDAEIPVSLCRQGEALDELGRIINSLADRLEPALCAAPPCAPCLARGFDVTSPLATTIHGNTDRIEAVTSKLMELNGRLEL